MFGSEVNERNWMCKMCVAYFTDGGKFQLIIIALKFIFSVLALAVENQNNLCGRD